MRRLPLDRLPRLLAECRFREEAYFRLYPDAKIATINGGSHHDLDRTQHVIVKPFGTSTIFFVDVELGLLAQAIDQELSQKLTWTDTPEDNPMEAFGMAMIAVLGLATTDETWTKEVQEIWKKRLEPSD